MKAVHSKCTGRWKIRLWKAALENGLESREGGGGLLGWGKGRRSGEGDGRAQGTICMICTYLSVVFRAKGVGCVGFAGAACSSPTSPWQWSIQGRVLLLEALNNILDARDSVECLLARCTANPLRAGRACDWHHSAMRPQWTACCRKKICVRVIGGQVRRIQHSARSKATGAPCVNGLRLRGPNFLGSLLKRLPFVPAVG
jgi:hypothetical protein